MTTRLKAEIALALCAALWGATFVLIQRALDDSSVFVFLAVRFALAAVVLAAMHPSALREINGAVARVGARLGFLLFSGFALQTAALLFTTASKTAFITGFSVVLVPILLALLYGSRIRAWAWIGAATALVGLYFLTVPEEAGAPGALPGLGDVNRGDVLTFGCAVLFAFHIVLVGRHAPHHPVGALTWLQVAVSTVLFALAIPVVAAMGWEAPRLDGTARLSVALGVTAVGATAVAFTVQVWAQRHTTPARTVILFTLEPVVAAITSYVALGERLGVRAVLGAALILAGILVGEIKAAPDASSPSPVD